MPVYKLISKIKIKEKKKKKPKNPALHNTSPDFQGKKKKCQMNRHVCKLSN